MVTCLYRAEAGRSLASRMEAVTIATDFAGGVLCAVELEGGLHFGLGSTLAFPRAAAEAIGGLEALVEYLADDHELGRMIADAGYKVVLSEVVVETFLPEYGWRAMFEHQLRWARTVRDLRKWGYVGVLLTFGLPWAMAAAVCAGGATWSSGAAGGGGRGALRLGILVVRTNSQRPADARRSVADSGARCGGRGDLVRQLWRRYDCLARGELSFEGWKADEGVEAVSKSVSKGHDLF